MDSVGLPEERAWDVYRPYVMHRLTKRGIPWAHAAAMIEEKKDVAKEALISEMEQRPVIMDRAPILHKFGVIALKPRLIAGDAIRVNQFINKGLNLDADGDNMNFHVPKSEDAVNEAFELLLPSKSLIQPSDMKSAMPRMISESAGGLYLASLPPDKKQKPRTFMTWKDAEHAYNRGELALDDPVAVLQNK
jgi:DNA-directed RNA polymerase subunit beta'